MQFSSLEFKENNLPKEGWKEGADGVGLKDCVLWALLERQED